MFAVKRQLLKSISPKGFFINNYKHVNVSLRFVFEACRADILVEEQHEKPSKGPEDRHFRILNILSGSGLSAHLIISNAPQHK